MLIIKNFRTGELHRFDTTEEAGKALGLKPLTIRSAWYNKGIMKRTYIVEYFSNNQKKAVACYDVHTKTWREFESCAEATEYFGLGKNVIHQNMKHNSVTAGRYRFCLLPQDSGPWLDSQPAENISELYCEERE